MGCTFLLLSKDRSVSKRHKHSALRVANAQFALQRADDILCFLSLASGQELSNDGDLLVLRLPQNLAVDSAAGENKTAHGVAGTRGDLFKVHEDEGHCEWLWLKESLLGVLRVLVACVIMSRYVGKQAENGQPWQQDLSLLPSSSLA